MENEKTKAPGFIANRIDVKAVTINCAAMSLNTLKEEDTLGELEDTNIMLLTNFGTIEGEIVLDNNNFFSDCNELRNTLLANAPQKEGIIINNSSSIILKNAKIIPYANPSYSIQLQDFSIFSDQIVGFTYGKKEIKE